MKTQIFKLLFFFWFLNVANCITATAQIVYTDINPNVELNTDGSVYNLDVNQDGITDYVFTLKLTPTFCSSTESFNAQLICDNSNSEVVQMKTRVGDIDTLDQNNVIDSNLFWGEASILYKNHWHSDRNGGCTHTLDGIWDKAGISFAGLRIKVNNQYYYGWVRIQVIPVSSVIIYDYAYNSAPNQSILAGDSGNIATGIHHIKDFSSIAISPNSFQHLVRISFSLSETEKTSVIIYDITGRVIKILANEMTSAGAHALTWDARDENGNAVSAGIYFLKVQSPDFSQTEKLMVVK